jgi:hypothetical protein
MKSGNIHYLGDQSQIEDDSPQAKALQHVAAAHRKLMYLQDVRRQLKLEYTARVAERDVAERELEHTKKIVDDQKDLLEEYESIIRAQAQLIGELRTKRNGSPGKSEERERGTADAAELPALTTRAIGRYQQLQRSQPSPGNGTSSRLAERPQFRLKDWLLSFGRSHS